MDKIEKNRNSTYKYKVQGTNKLQWKLDTIDGMYIDTCREQLSAIMPGWFVFPCPLVST